MSIATTERQPAPQPAPVGRRRLGNASGASMLVHGEPMLWLTGGSLVICLVMIVCLLGWVFWQGIGTFWPGGLEQIRTVDGNTYLGEVTRHETYAPTGDVFDRLPPEAREAAEQEVAGRGGKSHRFLLRTGNFDLTGTHFKWISDFEVDERTTPEWGILVERLEWGRFYGTLTEFRIDGKTVATTPEESWEEFNTHHKQSRERYFQRVDLEKYRLGEVNLGMKKASLAVAEASLEYGKDSPEHKKALQDQHDASAAFDQEYATILKQINEIKKENDRFELVLTTAQGEVKALRVADVVRAFPPNQLDGWDRASVYFSRWDEFIFDDPREANNEGGVFPAIVGTVLMTLIMSLAVVPFGVLAALYLREYAKTGTIVNMIRISINNLAGVPSIVFGVFGLGFFCYGLGKFIDGGPENKGITPWPPASWFLACAVLAAVATGAFFAGLAGVSSRKVDRTGWKRYLGMVSIALWIVASVAFVYVVAVSPYFHGFYRAELVNSHPTYGKGGLMWSSLTLALLTLPVVIVATEEALTAVPNSMREGSYACGAGKWQTIRRIVLPRAMPGIMTGMILAMARGAGEVAPLMLVGAAKKAESPLIDFADLSGSVGYLPTGPLHVDRSFMHLGFHLFDRGFQSQNVEASVPVVYTTTLLLILIIAVLNLAATWLRGRMGRKFATGEF